MTPPSFARNYNLFTLQFASFLRALSERRVGGWGGEWHHGEKWIYTFSISNGVFGGWQKCVTHKSTFATPIERCDDAKMNVRNGFKWIRKEEKANGEFHSLIRSEMLTRFGCVGEFATQPSHLIRKHYIYVSSSLSSLPRFAFFCQYVIKFYAKATRNVRNQKEWK